MLVLMALLLPVILGAMGLAVDLGLGFASYRVGQNTADAASYGAAILVADNDPSCTSGSKICMSFNSSDLYNAFVDAVRASDAPGHASPTINLYDPSNGGAPANTLGTIDIAAQYVNGTGGTVATSAHDASTYLYDDTTPIPTEAAGIRATVSWPQQTYFGRAVNWGQYTVKATATYVAGVAAPTQVALAPFAVWWDPPYGGCTLTKVPTAKPACLNGTPAQTAAQLAAVDSSGNPDPTDVCTIVNSSMLPCLFNNSIGAAVNQLSHPNLRATGVHGLGPGTPLVFFSNHYSQDAGTTIGTSTDPDYQLGSNDFKGYFGWTGSQTTCLNSYVGVTGNGNDGNNAYAALQSAITIYDKANNLGFAVFAVADSATKSGSVAINVYDFVPLIVDMNDIAAAGTNGPWIGYVDWEFTPTASTACPTKTKSGSYIQSVTPIQ